MSATLSFRAMGCQVLVAGADEPTVRAVERLFSERERRFSRFLPSSELSLVNRAAGRPVVVSGEFADAVGQALWAAEQTDGVVDPTLGDAIAAAGYDRDFTLIADTDQPPGAGRPGVWREVQTAGRLLRVPDGVALDLNGVAKSMAVDAALELLPADGWVSAGGDLAARGGLDVALPGGGTVRLVSGGIATSGSSRRTWNRNGRRMHHLIDAARGAPSRSPWSHVTACGASCLDADVAAKAGFLLGDDGPDWLDERGIPGRFLLADGMVVANRAWTQATAAQPACT
ncbi:MAG: FAD:protein FMN transferase [Gaiellales bacterium]